MVFFREEVRERKLYVRVLEMVDVFDYMILFFFCGKNFFVVWNKVFVNIDNVLNLRKFGWFMNEFIDFNCLEFSEKVYFKLIQIWSLMEELFRKLLIVFKGELNLLVYKFKIMFFMKKEYFEC